MKFSAFIILISATIALASPAAVRYLAPTEGRRMLIELQVSLNRATKLVRYANGNQALGPCVECPCDTGFGGTCHCVS